MDSYIKPPRGRFQLPMAFTIALWIISLCSTASGYSSSFTINDVEKHTSGGTEFAFILKCTSMPEIPAPFFIENPPRLIYDFNSTVLKYNKGQTTRIPVYVSGLEKVAIAQFQTNPDIVRVVFYFNEEEEGISDETVEFTRAGERIIFKYLPVKTDLQRRTDARTGAKNPKTSQEQQLDNQSNAETACISRISYLPLETGERFVFGGIGKLNPVISFLDNSSCLLIQVPDTNILLPKESANKYNVQIGGAIAQHMQVLRHTERDSTDGEIRFTFNLPEGETLDYTFYQTHEPGIYHLDVFPIASEEKLISSEPDSGSITTDTDKTIESKTVEPSTETPVEKRSFRLDARKASFDENSDHNSESDIKEKPWAVKIPIVDSEKQEIPEPAETDNLDESQKSSFIIDSIEDETISDDIDLSKFKISEILANLPENTEENQIPLFVIVFLDKVNDSPVRYLVYYQDEKLKFKQIED